MKKEGSSTVDATEDSANRRSIARWLPCRPPSTPGIGMFETFTMRATPAASAASTALVSNCTWSRVGEDTRNRARTPATALRSDAGSPRSPSTTSLTGTLATASGRRTQRAHGHAVLRQHAYHPPAEIAGRTDDEHRHALESRPPSAPVPSRRPRRSLCVARHRSRHGCRETLPRWNTVSVGAPSIPARSPPAIVARERTGRLGSALTETELRVVELVASGLNDRAIASLVVVEPDCRPGEPTARLLQARHHDARAALAADSPGGSVDDVGGGGAVEHEVRRRARRRRRSCRRPCTCPSAARARSGRRPRAAARASAGGRRSRGRSPTLRDVLARRVGELELEPALGEPRRELLDLDVDDLRDVAPPTAGGTRRSRRRG